MKVLSAREMFKKEEILRKCKSYSSGEQAVRKYGKINKNISYRITERTKWIYENSRYNVEILFQKENGDFDYNIRGFWDESEPTGGRMIGKRYTSALEYANRFINKLKETEDLSEEKLDIIYKEAHIK